MSIVQRGCNFWHLELEYVCFLIDNHFLRGDAGVDAFGWAEERREELKLRQEESAATSPGQEEKLMNQSKSLHVLMKEAVLLLKIVVGLVGLVCVVVIIKK